MENIPQQPNMQTPPPHKNWFSKPALLGYLFLGLVFAAAIALAYHYQYGSAPQVSNICEYETRSGECNDTPTSCIQVITTAKNRETGEVKDFPTPCDVPEGWEVVNNTEEPAAEVKTHTSRKFHVSFQYISDEEIIEEGNKIYLDGREGQFVEFFDKTPADSLSDAIRNRFLKGISEQDCYVNISEATGGFGGPTYPDSYEMAVIAYPIDQNNEEVLEQMENTKCPKQYQATNGLSYFLMDKNYPDRFFFFSIGQYIIPAENGSVTTGWQDTFVVLE